MIAKLVIAANATVSVPGQGDRFTVYASSVPVNVRADGLDSFSQYSQQTGVIYSPKTFSLLEVQNPTANPIVCQIYIGDGDGLIDTRNLLQSQPSVPVITTYYNLNLVMGQNNKAQLIIDKTGTVIQSPDGKNWYAVARLQSQIFNMSTVVVGNNIYPQFISLQWSQDVQNLSLPTNPVYLPSIYSTDITGTYQSGTPQPYLLSLSGNFYLSPKDFSYVGAGGAFRFGVVELYQAIAQ